MHSLNPRRHIASIVGLVLLTGLALLPLLAGPYPVFVAAQLITAAYLALAVDLGHSMGRVLSFCSGSFFALGAYAMFYVASHVSGELLVALPVVVVLVMASGVLVAAMVTRMRGAHAAVVATLAIGSVLALLANALSDITGGEDGLTFRAKLTFGGLPVATGVNGITYAVALLPLAALLLAYMTLFATPFGTVMRAIGENDRRSEQLGFNVGLRRVVIFAVAAGISAVGGALYCVLIGHISTAQFAPILSLNGVLWATVGGLGAPFGALIGSTMIYPTVEFAAGAVRSVDAVVGALLVLTALCFPRGICGALARLARPAAPQPDAQPRAILSSSPHT